MGFSWFKCPFAAEKLNGDISCPRCQKKMVKRTKNGVTIDKCVKCGGIWLDKGEIYKILGSFKKRK